MSYFNYFFHHFIWSSQQLNQADIINIMTTTHIFTDKRFEADF